MHVDALAGDAPPFPPSENNFVLYVREKIMVLAPPPSTTPDPTIRLSDKRRDLRIPTDDAGLMRLLHPLSESRIPIRVVDISKNGARIHLPVVLLPGALIQLCLQSSVIVGEVRYCRPIGSGFQAGIRIETVHVMPKPA